MAPVTLLSVEGMVYVIPFRDGGFGLMVAARHNPRTSSLVGYFFGPRLSLPPQIVPNLAPHDATYVAMLGDRGILTGKWAVLGKLDDYDRRAWQIPVFVEHRGGGSFRQRYDDVTLRRIGEEPCIGDEAARLPEAVVSGHGAAEIKFSQILDGKRHPQTYELLKP